MFHHVVRFSKKYIYRLHMEHDRLIEMPMFLVDSLHMRNQNELITLLYNVITFNQKKFWERYYQVLLKRGELFQKSQEKESDTIGERKEKPLEGMLNYKYDNEPYNELIRKLSDLYYENHSCNYDSYKNYDLFENISPDDEAYRFYVENRIKNENEKKIEMINNEERYSLIGYIPNEYFLCHLKNRIRSVKELFTSKQLSHLIFLFDQLKDIEGLKDFVEEFIGRYHLGKKKNVYTNRQIVHVLNICIKWNFKGNYFKNVVETLVEQMCMFGIEDSLKWYALGFSCLSRLHRYHLGFQEFILYFLKHIDECNVRICSILLHCVGYYLHEMRKRTLDKNQYEIDSANLKSKFQIFQCSTLYYQILLLESKIIERLVQLNFESMDVRSISCIFHYYYLGNKNVLDRVDIELFEKLLENLITKNIQFIKPRHYFMTCYSLILYKYFTNLDVCSYFLIQGSKLIALLKKPNYVDHLLFVLIGFTQNQLAFYKNKNTKYPKMFKDQRSNRMYNFKVENKYIDRLELSESKLQNLKSEHYEPTSCRSALLFIFKEILSLEYIFNKQQTLLLIEIFSTFTITFSSEIKQLLFQRILSTLGSVSDSMHTVLPKLMTIYGSHSSYMKSLSAQCMEDIDTVLSNYLKTEEDLNQKDSSFNKYPFLFNFDTLSTILFVLDQVDVSTNDFILHLLKLIQRNKQTLIKRIRFSSCIHFLHYVGNILIEKEEFTSIIHFLFSIISDYVDIAYKTHQNKKGGTEKKTDVNKNIMEETSLFKEIEHEYIHDDIHLKDIIFLLDSIRVHKAYYLKKLIGNIIEMMNEKTLERFIDEDIELINYIFVDMGLMNKNLIQETKKRGLSLALNQ